MKTFRYRFFAAAVVLAVGVTWAVARVVITEETLEQGGLVPAQESAPIVSDEMASLRGTIESLRREQLELRRALEEQRQVVAPPVAKPATVPHASLSEREQMQEVTTQLTQTIETEPRDSRWAPDAEREISGLFTHETLQGSRLNQVVCQSSLCRADIQHKGDESQEAFLENLPLLLAGRSGFFSKVESADGMAKSVVFIAREGTDLPTLLGHASSAQLQ